VVCTSISATIFVAGLLSFIPVMLPMIQEKMKKLSSLDINDILSYVHKIKRALSIFVLLLMAVVIAASVIELTSLIIKELCDTESGLFFLDITELFRVFGFIFMILIGFELMETVEMYFKKNVIHAEVVLLVAVIAVSRKVILLDLEKYEPIAIVGLAGIILSLGGCYALIKCSTIIGIRYDNRRIEL
jgi:uncharacterized membrane protein (DUF373 family)